jgi:hypothetical protein
MTGRAKETKYEQFMAGITNVNWKVTVDGEIFFVKIYGKGTEEFMNREASQAASRIAADAGAAPKVPYQTPFGEAFEWLHGYRTMDTIDFWDHVKLREGMRALAKVHMNTLASCLSKKLCSIKSEPYTNSC